MQQIYRKTPIWKCDFSKVKTTFYKNILEELLLGCRENLGKTSYGLQAVVYWCTTEQLFWKFS